MLHMGIILISVSTIVMFFVNVKMIEKLEKLEKRIEELENKRSK